MKCKLFGSGYDRIQVLSRDLPARSEERKVFQDSICDVSDSKKYLRLLVQIRN